MTINRYAEADLATAARRGVPGDQIRVARALLEVRAADTVAAAVAGAAKIDLSPYQIRSLYPAGGLTYDYVRARLDG
ncbi:hypothetical protein AU098_gp018 [Mycobacterium phage Apizium]|uniref:Uncharacterized protein n=1 Tax=Mycobacterium phage Apizium TaxID=1673886 RepID=A0A0H4IQE8_9CAUD|nr:hypothetical protein AU098_gp018 [Mycobacterium phage Apizium]AKO62194.1 hypothetical protein PBI_APIZIUM_18 [Mycobacterium phage Apizium]